MYTEIRGHKTTLELYAEQSDRPKAIDQAKATRSSRGWRPSSRSSSTPASISSPTRPDWLDGQWRASEGRSDADEDDPRRGATGVPHDGADARSAPEDHHGSARASTSTGRSSASSTIAAKAIEAGEGIDWATAEALGLRLAAARRRTRSVSPGQDRRARHLLAASFGAHDQETERDLYAAQQHPRRPGALRGHQLDALGRGGARLRVRLFAGRAQRR